MNTRRGRAAPVLALWLMACGGEPPREDAGPSPDADVGSTSQALGNIAVSWSEPDETPIGASPTHAVFAKRTSSCAENVVSVELETGDATTYGFWPGECRAPTAAAVDGDVFIFDATASAIFRYSSAGIIPGWVKVADTTGLARGLALDSVFVIWADNAGMFRMRRSGAGARETVNLATDARIIAQEGGTLYYTIPSRYGTELRSMQTNGGSDRHLDTSATPISQLGFDSTHLYWPDNNSSPHRLQRLHKVQRIVSTVTSSADRYYYVPMSTGSHLYFLFIQDSKLYMSRRNLANNNTVNAQFPQPIAPYHLRIGVDGVYTAGILYGFGSPNGVVHRGDL
jgi:hypothetical protein